MLYRIIISQNNLCFRSVVFIKHTEWNDLNYFELAILVWIFGLSQCRICFLPLIIRWELLMLFFPFDWFQWKIHISHFYLCFFRKLYTHSILIWTASSEFGTYRLCEQRRFRRAYASAQSRQNLRCSLIQAVGQEKPSDRKPDPWPLWMAGHGQLKFVMTECSKTQIRLTGLILKPLANTSDFVYTIAFLIGCLCG